MARNFNGGTDDVHWTIAGVPDAVGCISMWIKTTQATTNAVGLTYWNATSRGGFGLILNNTANKMLFQGRDSGGTARISLTSTSSINGGSWTHVLANYDRNNAGANALYINGTSEATGNSSAAWTIGSSDFFQQIGDNVDAFWPTYVGDIMEIGHWFGVNLTADEITALSKGYSPKLIRPASQVIYTPLVRDTHDLKRSATVSVTGGSVSDHGRMMGSGV